MSRRRFDSTESSVSLFPFLSILACMIGTLTLMITGVALTGMGEGRDQESVRRAQDHQVLQRKHREYQAQINVLGPAIASQAELERKLAAAREEAAALAIAVEAGEKHRADNQATATALQQQAEETRKKAKRSAAAVARLEKELEARSKMLAAHRQRLSERLVKVLPPRHGRPIKYKPYFVEATESGIVLHDRDEPHTVANAAITADKRFNDLLAGLSGKEGEQLVLLIRSNGLAARGIVLSLVGQRNVICGQIPLAGDGTLDLSGVKKP